MINSTIGTRIKKFYQIEDNLGFTNQFVIETETKKYLILQVNADTDEIEVKLMDELILEKNVTTKVFNEYEGLLIAYINSKGQNNFDYNDAFILGVEDMQPSLIFYSIGSQIILFKAIRVV
jgi:hypothetical protein